MTAKPARRPRVGDVFEVRTAKGLAYIQFVGMHPMNAHTVRVFWGTHVERPTDFRQVMAAPSYLVFCPIHCALKDGDVEAVASHSIPKDFVMPMKLINRALMIRDGKVPAWVVVSRTEQEVQWVPLEDVKGAPTATVYPYKSLVHLIETGWTPEIELQRMIDFAANPPPPLELPPLPPSDAPGGEEPSPLEVPHRTTHFFFFRRKKDAAAAAEALRERGLQIADVDKTDGKWMLVAETELIPGAPETDAMHDQLERLAEEHGGQYDGWETEV